MNNNEAQMLADWYSRYGGYQVLMCIYRDEFVLFAQVSDRTANAFRHLLYNDIGICVPLAEARSQDGLTWVFAFAKHPQCPIGVIDWSVLAETFVASVVQECSECELFIKDNRTGGRPALQSFCDLVAKIKDL